MKVNSVYSVKNIFEGAWAIEEGRVRFFLVTGEKAALLIDTGYGGGEPLELVKQLTDLPVTLAITHSDGDHIGGVGGFETAYMHPAEFDYFAENAAELTGVKLPVLKPLWEGDVIDLGGTAYEAVLLPGHTPGGIALWEKKKNVMFTGDSVSKFPVFMFSAGRNIEAYICSMEKLERAVPAGTRFYVSHGPMEQGPELLPHLVKGAKDVLSGSLRGVIPERNLPCLQYNCGEVTFFY
jgi:glyoxylase-like metal-dependent hydrolase (beta-lactamase superfamily II)